MRRLVARTMAKQVAKQAEKATAPFQFALSTKAGCERIAHIVQSVTDVDSNATVVSIDGVGAYDLISRNSMLRGLLRMENGDQILPFVRCFCGRPSMYLWEDELGETQQIPQGEGGEQGDPLMPMLFSFGQHPALDCSDRVQVRGLSGRCGFRVQASQIALPRLKLSSEKSSDVMRMLMSIRARPRSGAGQESPLMALRSSPGWPSW